MTTTPASPAASPEHDALVVPAERARPLALATWQILRDRSEADRRLVFEACRRRLRPTETTERQALALHALESFKLRHGHAPSRRHYDGFRRAQPDETAWPSATFIRSAFGSWPAASAALGEPEADPLVRRFYGNGRKFSRDDIVTGLRTWASQTTTPLRLKDFVRWCEDQRERHGTWLPSSPQTLYRHFGSWRELLDAAGLAAKAYPSSSHPGPASGFDLSGAPATVRRARGRHDLLPWLAFVRDEVGAERAASLTRNAFDELARGMELLGVAEGRVIRMPRSCTYADEFGSWPEAKMAAGWLSVKQAAREGSRERYSDEELIDALRDAIAAKGVHLTVHDYRRWRSECLDHLGNADARARIPCDALLRRRLGGGEGDWKAAVRAVGADSGRAT